MTKRLDYGDPVCDLQGKKVRGKNILINFLQWCKSNKLVTSAKVGVSDCSRHRFGMFATENIEKSEVLFEIPRSLLLWDENCTSLSLQDTPLESKSGWAKLVLVLMTEHVDPDSKWRNYMDFAPSTATLDLPLYWPEDIKKKLLSGTSICEHVVKDEENINDEYRNIVLPFIKNNKNMGFDVKKYSLGLYKHMVGFVMAYSFTEPNFDTDTVERPKMAPMADVLNHVAKHNAQLQFEEESLKMVAVQDIKEGTEIFNTYGCLSNSQLLQMYGFVEEDGENSNDTVDIPVESFKDLGDNPSFKERWNHLFKHGGPLSECEFITVGISCVLSFEELKLMLKVLNMDDAGFQIFAEQEWESDSSDSECSTNSCSIEGLSFSNISQTYGAIWRSMLRTGVQKYCDKLQSVLDEKTCLAFTDDINLARKRKIVTTLQGEISIMKKLIEACL